jgi:hypothetical protein
LMKNESLLSLTPFAELIIIKSKLMMWINYNLERRIYEK